MPPIVKDNPVVAVLLTSLTGLTALLAAFGGADTARRNHQTELLVAVVLVLLGLLLGGLGTLGESKWPTRAALLFVVLGFLSASLATIDHAAGRPSLSASVKVKPTPELDVTVKRDGLGSGDEMELFVEGRVYTASKTGAISDHATHPQSLLYRAFLGPNENGQIDVSLNIPLPLKPRFTAVFVQTWVPFHYPNSTKDPRISCGPQAPNGSKYAAACVLETLPPMAR